MGYNNGLWLEQKCLLKRWDQFLHMFLVKFKKEVYS